MEVVLEKFKFDEASEVYDLWSDELATLYTNFPYLATLDECNQRLSKMKIHYGQNPQHIGPFIIRSTEGEFLGLTGGDADAEFGEFEIWYFIKRSMWGRKIATSAVKSLIEIIKRSEKATLIKAEAVVDNEPSWKFLEKLGFKRTGILPEAHKKNGMTWDRYSYSYLIRS